MLSQPKDVVPTTSDVTPPPRKKEEAPASTEAPASALAYAPVEFKAGDLVTYLEQSCKITDVFSTKVQIKGVDDPSFEKVVLKADVKLTV